jgi:hypothetical protein
MTTLAAAVFNGGAAKHSIHTYKPEFLVVVRDPIEAVENPTCSVRGVAT